MSILCALFGHKSNEDVYNGGEYVRVIVPGYTDNIGREHVWFKAHCRRCDEWYPAGKFHRPQEWGNKDKS